MIATIDATRPYAIYCLREKSDVLLCFFSFFNNLDKLGKASGVIAVRRAGTNTKRLDQAFILGHARFPITGGSAG